MLTAARVQYRPDRREIPADRQNVDGFEDRRLTVIVRADDQVDTA
jgi:hypothetical protein